MCGLVGIVMKHKGETFPYDTFVKLMEEARIRGQHATGVSYFNKQAGEYFVDTVKQAGPTERFSWPNFWEAEAVIGHVRYSTSDLEYNQPIGYDQFAIVQNGVVTQEPWEKWQETFGVKTVGKNDTEILGEYWRKKVHPLELVNTSQACLMIEHEGDGVLRMRWWRNEQRPLYWLDNGDYIIVASTKDIIARSIHLSLEQRIRECRPCVEYSFKVDEPFSMYERQIREPLEDLQHVR